MLLGHDDAIAAFMEAAHGHRLHHAWLLTGPKGIGKGTFALHAARRLLAEAAGPPVDLLGLAFPRIIRSLPSSMPEVIPI